MKSVMSMTRKAGCRRSLGAALILGAVLCVSSAHAAQGLWTAEFGQGNFGYFMDQQGVRLYIGCPTENMPEAASDVSLQRVSDGKAIAHFTVLADGMTFEGPFDANSRVGANNFTALLDALRKTDAVVKFEGKSVSFPKSNAAKVLPKYGTKQFVCNLM